MITSREVMEGNGRVRTLRRYGWSDGRLVRRSAIRGTFGRVFKPSTLSRPTKAEMSSLGERRISNDKDEGWDEPVRRWTCKHPPDVRKEPLDQIFNHTCMNGSSGPDKVQWTRNGYGKKEMKERHQEDAVHSRGREEKHKRKGINDGSNGNSQGHETTLIKPLH